MAQGNSTTVHVDWREKKTRISLLLPSLLGDELTFFVRDVEVIHGEDGLRSEGFVDFVKIDIVDGDTGLVKGGRDSVGGTDTHDTRRHTNHSRGDVLTEDGQTELFSSL